MDTPPYMFLKEPSGLVHGLWFLNESELASTGEVFFAMMEKARNGIVPDGVATPAGTPAISVVQPVSASAGSDHLAALLMQASAAAPVEAQHPGPADGSMDLASMLQAAAARAEQASSPHASSSYGGDSSAGASAPQTAVDDGAAAEQGAFGQLLARAGLGAGEQPQLLPAGDQDALAQMLAAAAIRGPQAHATPPQPPLQPQYAGIESSPLLPPVAPFAQQQQQQQQQLMPPGMQPPPPQGIPPISFGMHPAQLQAMQMQQHRARYMQEMHAMEHHRQHQHMQLQKQHAAMQQQQQQQHHHPGSRQQQQQQQVQNHHQHRQPPSSSIASPSVPGAVAFQLQKPGNVPVTAARPKAALPAAKPASAPATPVKHSRAAAILEGLKHQQATGQLPGLQVLHLFACMHAVLRCLPVCAHGCRPPCSPFFLPFFLTSAFRLHLIPPCPLLRRTA